MVHVLELSSQLEYMYVAEPTCQLFRASQKGRRSMARDCLEQVKSGWHSGLAGTTAIYHGIKQGGSG